MLKTLVKFYENVSENHWEADLMRERERAREKRNQENQIRNDIKISNIADGTCRLL